MRCQHVKLSGGVAAIVCGPRRRQQRCTCGRYATLLCDWRTDDEGGTCDAPLCSVCTTSPAPNKDLCRKHVTAFAEWRAQRAAARSDQASRKVDR